MSQKIFIKNATQSSSILRIGIMRIVLPAVLMSVLFLLVASLNVLLVKPIYKAQAGVLDIQQSQGNVNIPLAGDWAIVWDEFVAVESLQERLRTHPHFISLPGIWNGLAYEDSVLPAQGKASLILQIKLPEAGQYVLKIPALYSSYRLWVGDELKVANPSLDDKFRQTGDVSKARVVSFNSQTKQVQLLLHVANYRHRVGGIWESIRLSPESNKTSLLSAQLQRDIAVLCVLGLVACALLVLAWRRKRRAYFFLALWAVLMVLRVATIDERLLFVALEIVDWELQQKLEYLFLYLNIPFFTLYLGYRFPRYFPAWLHLNMCALIAALVLLVLFTNAVIFSHTLVIFQLAVVLYGFAWLSGVCRYVQEQGAEAWLLLLGSAVLIATAMNDLLLANILFADSLLNGVNVSHYGALAFIACVWLLYLKQPDFPATTLVSEQAISPSAPLEQALLAYRTEGTIELKGKLCLAALKWAMYLWEQLSQSKLDLAEQSGLWKVTNDEGSLKTRTLDKYLRAETFPKRPRYRTVIKTLNFVAQQEGLAVVDVNLLVEASALLSE